MPIIFALRLYSHRIESQRKQWRMISNILVKCKRYAEDLLPEKTLSKKITVENIFSQHFIHLMHEYLHTHTHKRFILTFSSELIRTHCISLDIYIQRWNNVMRVLLSLISSLTLNLTVNAQLNCKLFSLLWRKMLGIVTRVNILMLIANAAAFQNGRNI